MTSDLSACSLDELADELRRRILDARIYLAQRRDGRLTEPELLASLQVRIDHEREAIREDVTT